MVLFDFCLKVYEVTSDQTESVNCFSQSMFTLLHNLVTEPIQYSSSSVTNFNALVRGRYDCSRKLFLNYNFYKTYQGYIPWAFPWTCPEANSTKPHWWLVKIGWGNGLVRQATNNYPSPCWPRSLSSYGFTRPQWISSCFAAKAYEISWSTRWTRAVITTSLLRQNEWRYYYAVCPLGRHHSSTSPIGLPGSSLHETWKHRKVTGLGPQKWPPVDMPF